MDHRVLLYGSTATPPPLKVPTRDQLCAVQMSFQGLTFDTPSYGKVWWWETLAWWPSKADRAAAYAAKRAAGDTHCILDLSGCYKEGIPGSYNDTGADFSQNLAGLVALAREAIAEGFYVDLRLAGDGRSKPKNPDGSYPYNDPNGMTYGHEWLMDNLPRIVDAFGPLSNYIVFVPGYDGVFDGWGGDHDGVDRQPARVEAFGKLFRSLLPNAVLGLEFSAGYIPVGEGGADYQPGGRMDAYDVIYGEFNGWIGDKPLNTLKGYDSHGRPDYVGNQIWQIVGRLVKPYHPQPDQPPDSDSNPPPFYLVPCARGERFFIAFEFDTYRWVRDRVSAEAVQQERKYFADMGCRYVC